MSSLLTKTPETQRNIVKHYRQLETETKKSKTDLLSFLIAKNNSPILNSKLNKCQMSVN